VIFTFYLSLEKNSEISIGEGAKKMNNGENLRLRNPEVIPTSLILEITLGDNYAVFEAFQEGLRNLDIEQEWQWYIPHKAWFARGQHWWTTPRGKNKEKPYTGSAFTKDFLP